MAPRGDTELHYGTELAIMGRRDAVERFCQANGLDLKRQTDVFTEILSTTAAGIAEVVIPPDSGFIGKTLKDVSLRQRYGATALAVFRVNDLSLIHI